MILRGKKRRTERLGVTTKRRKETGEKHRALGVWEERNTRSIEIKWKTVCASSKGGSRFIFRQAHPKHTSQASRPWEKEGKWGTKKKEEEEFFLNGL